MGVIYSPLKAAWHLEKIGMLRSGLVPSPAQVQLVISDFCNQDCDFCSYRASNGMSTEQFPMDGHKNPQRMIPAKKCFEILDDCAELGVKGIQFTGGGEPTVHPDHLEIFEHAQKLGLKTGLVTNGIKIKDHPVYDKFDGIRVSLDAGEKETYKSIRNHGGFVTALKNIERLSKRMTGVLGVGFVVTENNYKEIYDCAALAKSHGAQYLRVSAVFSTEGSRPYESIYSTIKSEIEFSKNVLEDEGYTIYDLFGARIEDLDTGSPDYNFSGYQYLNVYIGGNQKVYRCCTTSYSRHGEIGDLTEKSFYDWLTTRADNFNAKSCRVCQFNDKNEVINYLVSDPLHVEFV